MHAAECLLNMSPFTGIIPTPHSPRKEACGTCSTEEERKAETLPTGRMDHGLLSSTQGISESLKLASHTRLSAHRDCRLPP